MGERTPAELALQDEVRRLRERIAELDGGRRDSEALRESEGLLRGLFDSPGPMRGVVELVDGRIVHVSCNSAAAEMYGIGKESIAGKTAAEAGAAEDVVRVWVDLYEQARLTGQPVSMEYARIDAQGRKRWLLATASYLDAASAGNPRFGYTILDLTARKQVEEQVTRAQQTFSELVERAPFGIYIIDSQFRITHMNAASQEGAFRNVRPLIGRDFEEAMRTLWPEPVAAEIIARFRYTLETGESYYSPRFVSPRHDVQTVESYEWELHRMTLPDGQHGVICYYFDSTKLHEAEAARRDSDERLRFALEACQIGAWDLDLVDRTAFRSAEHARIFGYESSVPQWTFADFVSHVLPEYREPLEG